MKATVKTWLETFSHLQLSLQFLRHFSAVIRRHPAISGIQPLTFLVQKVTWNVRISQKFMWLQLQMDLPVYLHENARTDFVYWDWFARHSAWVRSRVGHHFVRKVEQGYVDVPAHQSIIVPTDTNRQSLVDDSFKAFSFYVVSCIIFRELSPSPMNNRGHNLPGRWDRICSPPNIFFQLFCYIASYLMKNSTCALGVPSRVPRKEIDA